MTSSRQAMHSFCEPYFHAINRWMKYDSESLFRNRIQVIAAIVEVINDSPSSVIEIEAENPAVPLLPVVIPSGGSTYNNGFDQLAYQEARKLVNENVFQIAGLYFQHKVLRGVLVGQESKSRQTATHALELLLRLPQEAGNARVNVKSISDDGNVEARLFPLLDLKDDNKQVYDSLLCLMPQFNPEGMQSNPVSTQESSSDIPKKFSTPTKEMGDGSDTSNGKQKTVQSSSLNESNKRSRSKSSNEVPASKEKGSKSSTKKVKKAKVEEVVEDIIWTDDHAHVTNRTRVAKLFPVPAEKSSPGRGKKKSEVMKAFFGTVVKYAAPTKVDSGDQLYHIVWDDEDEEDFYEAELTSGIKLFEKEMKIKEQQEVDKVAAAQETTEKDQQVTAMVSEVNGKELLLVDTSVDVIMTKESSSSVVASAVDVVAEIEVVDVPVPSLPAVVVEMETPIDESSTFKEAETVIETESANETVEAETTAVVQHTTHEPAPETISIISTEVNIENMPIEDSTEVGNDLLTSGEETNTDDVNLPNEH